MMGNINETALNEAIERYYQHVKQTQLGLNEKGRGELFKWDAIQCFRENWDIDAEDFYEMLDSSLKKTGSLLGRSFSKWALLRFTKEFPSDVKDLFINLFDERIELSERYKYFIERSKDIHERYNQKSNDPINSDHQSIRAISIYLWLRFPEKYYIYRYSSYKNIVNKLCKEREVYNSFKGFIDSQKLYITITKILLEYSDLKQEVNRILDEAQISRDIDPNYLTLTFDFVFFYEKYDAQAYNLDAKANLHMTNNTIKSAPLNQIFYGPAGTGKTYRTVEEAIKICDPELYNSLENEAEEDRWGELKERYDALVKEGLISFVTFHQSFSYEDFIEGIRAKTDDKGNIQYATQNGIFKVACEKANHNLNQNHVMIIDEINRGNIANIFGELITLLEPSKRKGGRDERSVTLPYSKERFSIPNNLYVIGTMNTSDHSLTTIDIALRRRFVFKEILPDYEVLQDIEIEGIEISQLLKVINARIEILLGRDHLIGHSYFLPLSETNEQSLEQLGEIFKHSIIPLLQEYFFSDWERIRWVFNDQAKEFDEQFIQLLKDQPNDLFSLDRLFPNKDDTFIAQDRRYQVNHTALRNIISYEKTLV